MRALALVLLALGAVWPSWRLVRMGLGGLAGVALVRSVWEPTFHGPFTTGSWSNAWVVPLVVLISVGAVVLLPLLASPGDAWLGWRWALLAGSAAAVYGCVPETDQMREVAVVLVAGGVIERLRRSPLPSAVSVAAWGLVAWSALYGATGRPSALIGGLFALLPPLAAAAVARLGVRVASTIGAVWVSAAVAVARTGGVSMQTRPAVAATAAGAIVACAISAMLWRRWTTRPPDA